MIIINRGDLMNDVNVKNVSWMLIFLLILFVIFSAGFYFYTHDNSSIFTQINNPDQKE